jgi:Fic-DOC domain mobile mystery protein B
VGRHVIEAASADDHATPLTPDERGDLIPTHITTRSELNQLEQQNIATADIWVLGRKHYIFRERFLKSLHHRMFNRVWRWAGRFRTTERNLGVKSHLIETELRTAIDDTRFWMENKSYSPDELALRFHHRLVAVHPFPNGNGRWSRLVADALISQLGGSRFTWGSANLAPASEVRDKYIAALKAADNHDLQPLLKFARS